MAICIGLARTRSQTFANPWLWALGKLARGLERKSGMEDRPRRRRRHPHWPREELIAIGLELEDACWIGSLLRERAKAYRLPTTLAVKTTAG